jgi:hypothetical protein
MKSSAHLNVLSQSLMSTATASSFAARAVLRHLHESAFGVCEQCQKAIHPNRLVAIPWASLCIHCQEEADGWGALRKCRVNSFQKVESAMAASIELVSLLLAEGFGVPALLHAHSSIEVVLVYAFGIACGALGSRLSAICRERVSERLPRRA